MKNEMLQNRFFWQEALVGIAVFLAAFYLSLPWFRKLMLVFSERLLKLGKVKWAMRVRQFALQLPLRSS